MQVPAELKIKYLDRRKEDIQILISSLERDDYAPAAKLGHQVKGNADTFEFPRMAPIGIEIENAARSRDKEKLRRLIKMMDSEIQSARLTFQ